ncbi:hypothetical protein GF402_04485 [Candidatus Fermentibacteria bacterium]|nr:hypothetical protein [Candidatus Fermentibacteria bacterium]
MSIGRLAAALLVAVCFWVLVSLVGLVLGDYPVWHRALAGSSAVELLTRLLGALASGTLFLVLAGPEGAGGSAGRDEEQIPCGDLSEAGLRLSLAEDRDELFRRLGEEIAALVGEALVFVSAYDRRTGFITTVYSSGLGKVATGLVKRLGEGRHSISFAIDPESVTELKKGQLLRLSEGLHQTTFFRVSRSLCRLVERIYGLSTIYGVGLSWRDVIYGSVCIAPRGTEDLPHGQTVEMLCRETSAALHSIGLEKNVDILREECDSLMTRLGEVIACGAELSAVEDPDLLFRTAVEHAVGRLGVDRFSFWLATDEPDEVQGTYGTDEEGNVRDERGTRRLIPSDNAVWDMLREDAHYRLDKSVSLLNYKGSTVGTGDRIYAPARVGEDLVGLVSADNLTSGKPLQESDGLLMALYGGMIGTLYEGLRLRSRRSS